MVCACAPCVCLWVRRSASARIHILRPIAIASDLFSLFGVLFVPLASKSDSFVTHIHIYFLSSLFVAFLCIFIYWIVVLLPFSFFFSFLPFIFLFREEFTIYLFILLCFCIFFYHAFALDASESDCQRCIWCDRVGKGFQRITFYYYFMIFE